MKVAVTTLAFCVAALLALGLVMLYSSSVVKAGAHDLMMQLIWGAVGLTLCVVTVTLDYQWFKKFGWYFYLFAIALLGLVFVPHIGHASHGAHRWISKFGFSLQPSEFAKLALIIALAGYCDRFQRQMRTFKSGVLFPGAIIAVILGLIFIEPDRGQTILMAAVSGGMLLLAGVRWFHVLVPAAAGVGGLAFSLMHDSMRQGRISAWLHPDAHADGAAFQANQAMYGLGAGGWTGLGLGNGVRKFGWLPEIHTDFILANIGEELGLVATLAVVIAFFVFVFCGLYVALHAKDTFGTLLAAGVTLLIGLQAMINIGVVTGALPNKGLALPFISYGGSSLVAALMCVGILLSVARQANPAKKISPSEFVSDKDDNPFAAKAPAT